MSAPRRQRQDVHGWLILDKPVGMTSTHAVSAVRRLFNAKKAGHAGTLDPLASGLLPLAFGEDRDGETQMPKLLARRTRFGYRSATQPRKKHVVVTSCC